MVSCISCLSDGGGGAAILVPFQRPTKGLPTSPIGQQRIAGLQPPKVCPRTHLAAPQGLPAPAPPPDCAHAGDHDATSHPGACCVRPMGGRFALSPNNGLDSTFMFALMLAAEGGNQPLNERLLLESG